MEIKIVSKKTRNVLFVEFDIVSPSEQEIDLLSVEPPGALHQGLVDLEEEMRTTGEISGLNTALRERMETLSGSFHTCGGYFELRDELASDALISRLGKLFEGAKLEVDYQ